MTEDREFDPRLLTDANRSLSWIFRCFDAFKRNPGQRIGDLITPHITAGRCDLINPGLVLAACYIYFVYPREATIGLIDVAGLDVSSFVLSRSVTSSELLRRLRNSLSHARFSIDAQGFFTFRDQRPDGTDVFSARIHFAALGTFVDSFGERAIKHLSGSGQGAVH